MRYSYSIVRFVPDPVRGEFVNVGAVVGSDESSEWQLRTIGNLKRARALDEKGVLPLVWSFVDDVGRRLDSFTEAVEAGVPWGGPQISEGWLARLAQESRNVVQLSRPAVVVAETVEEALRVLFEQFVMEPETLRFPFRKKTTALKAVRVAYRDNGLLRGRDFAEAAMVRGLHHRESFDFLVGNGRAVQLAHTWSFQIPDQAELSEQIKAWAWTVEDIRENGGGEAQLDERRLAVPQNVDIQVVYVPPVENGPRDALNEALAAFQRVGATAVQANDADAVGRRARQLLFA